MFPSSFLLPLEKRQEKRKGTHTWKFYQVLGCGATHIICLLCYACLVVPPPHPQQPLPPKKRRDLASEMMIDDVCGGGKRWLEFDYSSFTILTTHCFRSSHQQQRKKCVMGGEIDCTKLATSSPSSSYNDCSRKRMRWGYIMFCMIIFIIHKEQTANVVKEGIACQPATEPLLLRLDKGLEEKTYLCNNSRMLNLLIIPFKY